MQLSQKDEEILAHLTDIECEELEPTEDEDGDELAGFKLTFHFGKNPNFDHEQLVGCLHLYIAPARISSHQGHWGCSLKALFEHGFLDASVCILAL